MVDDSHQLLVAGLEVHLLLHRGLFVCDDLVVRQDEVSHRLGHQVHLFVLGEVIACSALLQAVLVFGHEVLENGALLEAEVQGNEEVLLFLKQLQNLLLVELIKHLRVQSDSVQGLVVLLVELVEPESVLVGFELRGENLEKDVRKLHALVVYHVIDQFWIESLLLFRDDVEAHLSVVGLFLDAPSVQLLKQIAFVFLFPQRLDVHFHTISDVDCRVIGGEHSNEGPESKVLMDRVLNHCLQGTGIDYYSANSRVFGVIFESG